MNNKKSVNSISNILLFFAGASIAFNTLETTFVIPISYVLLFTVLYAVSVLPKLNFQVIKMYFDSKVFSVLYFLLYLILINIFFTLIYSDTKQPILNASILLNMLFFYSVLVHSIEDERAPRIAIYGFTIGCIALAFLFVRGYQVSLNISSGRLTIFDLNENDLGIYMAMSSVIIYADFILQNRWQLNFLRYLGLIPIALMVSVMFATASRTALLILILSFIFSVFLFKGHSQLAKYVYISLAIIIAVVGYQKLISSDLVVIERIMYSDSSEQTAGRTQIWGALWPSIRNNPVFGYGEVGYYEITKTAFSNISGHSYGAGYSPHNVVVEVLAYTGLIGLILMIRFWKLVFMNAWKKYKSMGELMPLLLLIPLLFALFSGQALVPRHYYLIYLMALIPSFMLPKK